MDWLKLSKDLIGIATALNLPGSQFGGIAISLINTISTQSGMTTEQLLARAEITLSENERLLLEDLTRLGGPLPIPNPPTPTPAPTPIPIPDASDLRTAAEIQSRIDRLKAQLAAATDAEIIAGINKKIARQEIALGLAKEREGG